MCSRPVWIGVSLWLAAGLGLAGCSGYPLSNTLTFKPIGKPSRNSDQASAYCRYEEIKISRFEPRQDQGFDAYKDLLAANSFMIACMRNQGYELLWISPPYRRP
jgi:hypothetical protein